VLAARCANLPNVRPPQRLDLLAPPWPGVPGSFDAVFCANLLHISPWATCAALMQVAAGMLQPGGPLLVYGPFVVDGEPTAASNLGFDADLRARDPRWGLRRLADVGAQARLHGLALVEQIGMPANNLLLVFSRAVPAPPA
jgi:Protein of unknown function (DUF938)